MDPGVAPWEAWIRATWLSHEMLKHAWLWPLCEILHYFGLSLLIGAVGLFDLRALGVAKAIPPIALHRLIPLGVAGYALNLLTGICFIAGFPDQYAYNDAFRLKLALMVVAGLNIALFYSTAFKGVRDVPAGGDAPGLAKLLTTISLGCWIGVLICGRLLTFFRPPFFH